MKRNIKLLRWSLICLLLSLSSVGFAQTTPTTPIETNANLKVGPSKTNAPDVTNPNFTALQNASVFCYNVGGASGTGSSFTLTASTSYVDGATTIPFDNYIWLEVNSDGTTNTLASTIVTQGVVDATPGYHKYRVHGRVNTVVGGPICQSDEYDEFVIFVLPQLTIASSVVGTPALAYCTDAPPTGATEIKLQAAAPAFVGTLNSTQGYANPTAGDFTYEYKWFKKKVADATWPTTAIAGATANTYNVVDTEVGSFNYKVVVNYKVRSGCGVYEGTTQSAGVDVIIKVTPKPGKATISIAAN